MKTSGQILVLNAGSSSLKLGLFDAMGREQHEERQVNWDSGRAPDFASAVRQVLTDIDTSRVTAVGHRVVHGGSDFTHAVVIDVAVRAAIEALSALAPLHNGPALAVIDAVSNILPGVPQIAAFDTAFHATLSPSAYLYALPYAWYERWGVRRYGFHGLSHAYCASRCAELLEKPLAELKIVSCHLGSGCSLAAIANGRSVATTMGFTPLDGLVMATRPGAVDPGILTFILGKLEMSVSDLESLLYHASGLKGLSGISSNMREILASRAAGNPRAGLAFDVYVARLREAIGAMTAALDGVDAIVFTGGVGEHVSEVRAAACTGFGWMGLALDEVANERASPDADIATRDSRIRVLALHTREELMVAREAAHALHGAL